MRRGERLIMVLKNNNFNYCTPTPTERERERERKRGGRRRSEGERTRNVPTNHIRCHIQTGEELIVCPYIYQVMCRDFHYAW